MDLYAVWTPIDTNGSDFDYPERRGIPFTIFNSQASAHRFDFADLWPESGFGILLMDLAID
jgi:hypothetical protein